MGPQGQLGGWGHRGSWENEATGLKNTCFSVCHIFHIQPSSLTRVYIHKDVISLFIDPHQQKVMAA